MRSLICSWKILCIWMKSRIVRLDRRLLFTLRPDSSMMTVCKQKVRGTQPHHTYIKTIKRWSVLLPTQASCPVTTTCNLCHLNPGLSSRVFAFRFLTSKRLFSRINYVNRRRMMSTFRNSLCKTRNKTIVTSNRHYWRRPLYCRT